MLVYHSHQFYRRFERLHRKYTQRQKKYYLHWVSPAPQVYIGIWVVRPKIGKLKSVDKLFDVLIDMRNCLSMSSLYRIKDIFAVVECIRYVRFLYWFELIEKRWLSSKEQHLNSVSHNVFNSTLSLTTSRQLNAAILWMLSLAKQ